VSTLEPTFYSTFKAANNTALVETFNPTNSSAIYITFITAVINTYINTILSTNHAADNTTNLTSDT
jgi:hypothetical protein